MTRHISYTEFELLELATDEHEVMVVETDPLFITQLYAVKPQKNRPWQHFIVRWRLGVGQVLAYFIGDIEQEIR